MKIVLYSNKHRVDDNRIVELEAKAFVHAGFETVVYGRIQGVDTKCEDKKLKACKKRNKDCLKQCVEEAGDIYIFHDPGLLKCAVRLKRKGYTVLFDSHENYEEKIKTRFADKYPFLKVLRKMVAKAWWIYEKRCIQALDGTICADRTVKVKYGGKCFLLPNMPSKEFYENLPERTADETKTRLIYVGTLTWDRGIVETIKSLELCKHQNIEFHVIGDTTDEKLKEYIRHANKTIWHGRVQWNRLKEYLVNTDIGTILLQPTEAYTYYPGENIVKLWEYMSIGVPVLLSDFPGLIELNNKLQFGKTVKSDDLQEIASAIDWLIDHPQERKAMGENGRACVLNKYNAENYTKDLLRFIEHEIH